MDLSAQFELLYSPLVDTKVFPAHVDIALVEGSVSTDEDEHKIRLIRAHTGTLVSLGDCAVTGNSTASIVSRQKPTSRSSLGSLTSIRK